MINPINSNLAENTAAFSKTQTRPAARPDSATGNNSTSAPAPVPAGASLNSSSINSKSLSTDFPQAQDATEADGSLSFLSNAFSFQSSDAMQAQANLSPDTVFDLLRE